MLFRSTSFLLCGSLGFIVACGGPSSPSTNTGSGGATTTGTGGGTGTGGAPGPGSGGSSVPGSGGGGSGGAPAGDGGPMADCTFSNVMGTVSTKIATVGIVTWATSLPSPTSASIDFGLTTAYGMKAPVDLTAMNYRTLLLGMKPSKMYHYRITASSGAGTCSSGDNMLMTGPAINGVPKVTVTTMDATKVSGGFLVTGQYPSNAGGAYIFDGDGDVVWSFKLTGNDVTSARMSYDGKYMWISSDNCCAQTGKSTVHRVSMDGMTDENLSSQFPGQNHQLTILPDDTVAFYGYNVGAGCDDIQERSPAGVTKVIVNSGKAQGVNGGCHINTIQYSKMDDTLIFSDLDHSSYTKVKRTGETVWVLNGPGNQFGGGNSLWTHNHGLDILGLDKILIFNNGAGSSPSQAVEWQLTLTGTKAAMKGWSYQSSPGIHTEVMGDVQRMANGNTIVAYSTNGVLHEVSAQGTLLQSMSWPAGAGFGFIEKRLSLYGPPPK